MEDESYCPYLPPIFNRSEGYDLGRSVDFGGVGADPAAPIDRIAALEKVAGAFKQDRAFAEHVVRTLGWDNLNAARPKQAPRRMPMREIRAIECSISFSPPRPMKGNPAKPRRARPDRDALPYYVTIQVFDAKSKGLANPAWKGSAQLRTPARAKIDARKKDKLTSLSADYAKWIEDEVAPSAEEAGMYVGFLMDKQKGQGTYYHEFQVILISQEAVHNLKPVNALIISIADGETKTITLPRFDNKSSKGPLGGNFILQSRGTVSRDLYVDWKTGTLKFA